MGSRISVARPMSPSPFRSGAARSGLDEIRVVVVGRAQLELLGRLVVLVDRAAGVAGQLAGAGDDRVEHRLDVERRADGLADLAQRGQLSDRWVSSPVRASSSLNRRTFSMAMTAWSAKVCEQRDLRCPRTVRARARADADRRRWARLAQHRDARIAAGADARARSRRCWYSGSASTSGTMDRCAFEDRAARTRCPARAAAGSMPAHRLACSGRAVALRRRDGSARRRTRKTALNVGLAQPHGAPDDRVEDRLHVGLRLADDPQDLAGRRLLLERSVRSRLRASSSLNSRTFSMAMTAWSAKVLSSAISLSENGPAVGDRPR